MTLTELKYIVAVAREKHFGRAAEACYVSQPTLSVAVKKLEEELDVKLFERSADFVSDSFGQFNGNKQTHGIYLTSNHKFFYTFL